MHLFWLLKRRFPYSWPKAISIPPPMLWIGLSLRSYFLTINCVLIVCDLIH